MTNLVAVGDNCLDVYLTKDVMTVGGNALNVAAHWRKAGCAARYFGAVGQDRHKSVRRDCDEHTRVHHGTVRHLIRTGLVRGEGWT